MLSSPFSPSSPLPLSLSSLVLLVLLLSSSFFFSSSHPSPLLCSRVCDECYEQMGGSLKNVPKLVKRRSLANALSTVCFVLFRFLVVFILIFSYALPSFPSLLHLSSQPSFAKMLSFWALPEKCLFHIFGYLDMHSLVCGRMSRDIGKRKQRRSTG